MGRERILVATDLSEKSDIAVEKAITISKKYDRWLEVLHVIDPPLFQWTWGSENLEEQEKREHHRAQRAEVISKEIKDSLNRRHDKLNVDIRVGAPSDEIVNYAISNGASLIVLGDTGEHHPLANFLFGTTTKNVIENSKKPVLVVRNGDFEEYKNILIPTDMSDESKVAIEFTSSMYPDAKLYILHVVEIPSEFRMKHYGISLDGMKDMVKEKRERAKCELEKFVSGLNINNEIEQVLAEGSLVSDIVLAQTDKINADLISLNAHQVNGLTARIIGSISNDILDNSKRDCLIYQKN